MGQPRPLFLFIFILFKHKFYRKNCRLQRDSSLDRRSRSRARCHLTTPRPYYNKSMFLLVTYVGLNPDLDAKKFRMFFKNVLWLKTSMTKTYFFGEMLLFSFPVSKNQSQRSSYSHTIILWKLPLIKICLFALRRLIPGKRESLQGHFIAFDESGVTNEKRVLADSTRNKNISNQKQYYHGVFLKWAIPASFSYNFGLFEAKISQTRNDITMEVFLNRPPRPLFDTISVFFKQF